jgi:cytochrome c-type biogenesis protein CcmH
VLQKQIAEARARMGGKDPAPMAQQAPKPAAKGKTEVKVSVNLDSKLKTKAAPGDTVFIFARAVQGPPMPLAIVKKQVKDLPVTVSLNDAMAMMPNMTMSSVPKIYIGARISKSGNAMPQTGDLQGRTAPITTGKKQAVTITISQEVM